LKSVVKRDRKLILDHKTTARLQLFNLHNDPDEIKNLYYTSPDDADPLLKELNGWLRMIPLYTAPGQTSILPESDLKTLRSLHYIE